MLNDQKLMYIAQRRAGVEKKQAAIGAGYSARTASQAASRLERDPEIRNALDNPQDGAKVLVENGQIGGEGLPVGKIDSQEYADSKQFLLDAMNDVGLSKNMRLDAAKTLLPYQHKKLGEEGKKSARAKSAEETQGKTGFKPRVVS